MTLSGIRAIRTFCDKLISAPNWREVVKEVESGSSDFEVDGVRFINSADIDRIQQDELSGDPYILGCFNAWFLASILEIDQDVIEAMQEAEAFEALGKLILSMDKLSELQQEYASADGYGHHFNHYDGSEEELLPRAADPLEWFHVFDNRG